MTGIAYRREIDGLRTIEVSSVILNQADIAPRAGFIVVEIFFVISGYLIIAPRPREHTSKNRMDLHAIYARQVRRIFPAALAVVSCVVMVGLLMSPEALKRTT